MKFLTSTWIASALGHNQTPKQLSFTKISTDSRQIKKGDLFFALKGEAFDGNHFLEAAAKNGAIAAIHDKHFNCPDGLLSFPVEDTLDAYRKVAKAWAKEFSIPKIAVAGSSGKTTSKEYIAAICTGKYSSVLKTQSSQNGFQGIPSTLLQINENHQVAVIEIGIDELGAMEQHLDLVQPDYGLLTSIGEEHLEKILSIENVAREEGFLFSFLKEKQGIALVNLDDPWIEKIWNSLKPFSKSQTYSFQKSADFLAKKKNEFIHLTIQEKEVSFRNPLIGNHNDRNLLGAIALASVLGLTADEIEKGLQSFQAPPGRSCIEEINGVTYYLDFYNANPSSVKEALSTIKELSGAKTWVCLGDMLEMGAGEEALHRELAKQFSDNSVAGVFLFGNRMKWLQNELEKTSTPSQHFQTHEDLAKALKTKLSTGDKVLLKGSRGMKMEKVWDLLSP
ncbi:MAG: UDP-N-acetylmuramoyl-tripeptide--D-alanyl-D-alanine ligase [Oligoflexia bacterium]|nr:UDP-N-acetylmuramoyl-tripeptide--D-alanyl-D-alanine ligase [Oligoflexia bacterium]